jgi:hypothetical protein
MPRGKNLRPEAADGKRFGDPGGADPRQATKMGPPKWSIRKQLAYLAAQNHRCGVSRKPVGVPASESSAIPSIETAA